MPSVEWSSWVKGSPLCYFLHFCVTLKFSIINWKNRTEHLHAHYMGPTVIGRERRRTDVWNFFLHFFESPKWHMDIRAKIHHWRLLGTIRTERLKSINMKGEKICLTPRWEIDQKIIKDIKCPKISCLEENPHGS